MGVIYEKADEDVLAVVQRMLHKYHGELTETAKDLRIDVLMASHSDGDAAVKLHGRACYAVVRVVNYRDRVKGCGDAEIVIDEAAWKTMPPRTRDALVDHELYHLVHKKDAKGRMLFDDLGRPKLAIRLHDVEFGWFNAIADRHQGASIERMQAEQMFVQYEQLYFPFARNLAGVAKPTPGKDAGLGSRPSMN